MEKRRVFLFIGVFLLLIYSISEVNANPVVATGGDNIYDIEINGSVYRVHVFTTVGNSVFETFIDLNVDVLVVGGGGGGGTGRNSPGYRAGGGGGAGGYIVEEKYKLSIDNHSVYIGLGGLGAQISDTSGLNGNNSFFLNLIAIGGGGGAGGNRAGKSGGSGGGGATNNLGGTSQVGQGHNGGRSSLSDKNNAGGGGGAGNNGQDGNGYTQKGGNGGIGKNPSYLFGYNYGQNGWFAGGGGGAGNGGHGSGGSGGGGSGNGNHGLFNSGGGGGGGYSGNMGGNGGSGIVIIRYEITPASLNISSPNDFTLYSSQVLINFSATNANYIWYFNGTHNSTAINASLSLTETFNAHDGENSLIFYANNTVGHITSESITFNVDAKPPQISFEEPTPSEGEGRIGSFLVNVSIFEKNLANVTWYLEGVSRTINLPILKPLEELYEGLVLFMDFEKRTQIPYNEDETFVYDYSGNENHGTVIGATYNATGGKYGGAFEFDGVNDYIILNSSFGVVATGGNEVYDFIANGINGINGTTYRVHKFTTVGESNFNVLSSGEIEYLIVGGGGGGGSGGFGGGGVISMNNIISPGLYLVQVGSRGLDAPSYGTPAGNGNPSSIFNIIVQGGGGGGRGTNGVNGASGGGGGSGLSGGTLGGSGILGQGYDGGRSTGSNNAGGGGGAGNAGSNGNSNYGGKGGDGKLTYISGNLEYYGAGRGGWGQSGYGSNGLGYNNYGGALSGIVVVRYILHKPSAIWIKPASTNVWEHVAFNGTHHFKNGVLGTPTFYPIAGNIIGINAEGDYFNGTIDQLMIYNRSLSQDEIKQIYYSQLETYPEISPNKINYIQELNNFNAIGTFNLKITTTDLNVTQFFLEINQSGLTSDSNLEYYVSAKDIVGNLNSTGIRIIKGNVAPEILSIEFSPNLTDLNAIDPNVTINISVSIFDPIGNLNHTILQWKNSLQNWTDILSIQNITGINFTYEGENYFSDFLNFTLPEYEDNITVRILAFDELGDFSISNESVLQSFWDCSWDFVLEVDEISGKGYDEMKNIGELILYNKGDDEFENGCSILFGPSYIFSSFTSEYSSSFDSASPGVTPGISFTPTGTIILNPKEELSLNITVGFPAPNFSLIENPLIRVSANVTDSIDKLNQRSLQTKIYILPEGPYLFQRITSSPSFVYLREGNFTISSYIRNIAGDDSINNTAHNVTYYWEIPEVLKDYLSSSLNNTFYNISNSSQIDASLTFELDDNIIDKFHDIVGEELNFTIFLYGYSNVTSDLEIIKHANNISLLNISVPIIFNYPPDYTRVIEEKPPEEKPPTPGGGGGAGPSTSTQPLVASFTQRERLFQTNALYELVRGKDDTFVLTVENTFDGPLEDINVRLVGFLSQYLDINPKGTFILQMNESMDFEISVSAPEYFTQGVYDLTFMIEGIVNQSREFETNTVYRFAPIMESRNIELYIQEISRQETEEIIYLADDLLQEMIEAGFNTYLIQQLMQDFDKLLNDRKYSDIKDLTDKIKEQRDKAFTSREIMDEVRALIKSANEKGLFAPEAGRILLLAESAFERGDYDLALQRANDAKTTAAMETAGKFNLWFFIKNNAKELAIAFVILCFIIYLISLSIKYALIKHKIKANNEEIKVITELIKETQRECFEKSKLSIDEYKDTIYQYDKMMNKLFNEITELQTKKTHMISLWKGEEKRLFAERELIINHIKEIQVLYIKENKLEMHTYDNRMKSYNERLSEIEEGLATIDAERRMKHAKV
jgi:hypothetical protein